MFYSYSSGYHIPSSPSLPGAWSSAWSLPQQHLDYEALEIKRVNDSSDCQEPTSSSKTELPGALLHTSYLSLSQSSLASSQRDHDADSNTSPEEYDSPSSCLSHKSTPSNDSLDTLSLFPPSVSNSPNSVKFSISSEIGDINRESIHSCDSLRRPTEIAPPHSFHNNPLLDQTGHIPKVVNTGRDYSPELRFYPNSLLLSQPDGKNTWTLFLDPTVSHPATISESLLELRSLTSASDEAIARTFPSVSSTPRRNACLSLPSSQDDDIAKFSSASSDMIVSSTCSLQQRRGGGTISDTGNADLYLPHGLVSHCQPRFGRVLDPQQPSRSKKLIKKSKNIFGRFKKLFSPKGTVSEDIHAHTAHQSTISFTPSSGQSFSLADEKYTYEYHARPKTLKEIKSQRRFSLPFALVGTSSRVTPPFTKRNDTTSVSRSQSRIYIASQNEFAA